MTSCSCPAGARSRHDPPGLGERGAGPLTGVNTRPRPPERLLGSEGFFTHAVAPAPELHDWARATFIDEAAPLVNEEHAHLREARLGFLWTSAPNAKQGNRVVGLTEECKFLGNRWAKVRFEQQVAGWFGDPLPHFLLTFDAGFAEEASDAAFCALVEHELLHCGQERDGFGCPKFTKDGEPRLAMRGHDVEEFVSVVRRYGVGAAAGRTADLVEAARATPLICAADVAGVCGTCGGKV